LQKYELAYDARDIIGDPRQREEMVLKSGQSLSPVVEINGHILADVSGEEVEAYLLAQKLVAPNDRVPEIPLNQPCVH
jgi:monothiol glutaredoxin